jgi:hypothetical protein
LIVAAARWIRSRSLTVGIVSPSSYASARPRRALPLLDPQLFRELRLGEKGKELLREVGEPAKATTAS